MALSVGRGWGMSSVAKKRLNLDALIRREDLAISTSGKGTTGQGGIPVSELRKEQLHFALLRKPGFQRVTNDWDIDNVVTLIKSFRDGQLIPAIILWRSQVGYNFVIDGAHRLSALMAWVNDDYGAGPISRQFFNDRIPTQQKEYADECRQLVAAEIGTYADVSSALRYDNPTAERVRWASNIGQPLHAQWVEGDAETAENSFLAINQRAVEINETEKYMIVARRKPNVIAARALAQSATGYEYWSIFATDEKNGIRKKATELFRMLFEPDYAELSHSIEMPVAGKAYSADALRISLEVINYTNDLRSRKALEELNDDADGRLTLRFLERAHGVAKHVSGASQSSLGLHPAVYFWGATGKHHPSAFLAIILFVQYLIHNNKMIDFCFQRAAFEDFLVKNHSVLKNILGKYGGWTKSAPSVFELYKMILAGLEAGGQDNVIMQNIIADRRFAGLEGAIEVVNSPGKKVSRETKNAVRSRELLRTALLCPVCHARLPSSAFSDDHKKRVQDGGRGEAANIQLTHPYCNSGFKEHLAASGKDLPQRRTPSAEFA